MEKKSTSDDRRKNDFKDLQQQIFFTLIAVVPLAIFLFMLSVYIGFYLNFELILSIPLSTISLLLGVYFLYLGSNRITKLRCEDCSLMSKQ